MNAAALREVGHAAVQPLPAKIVAISPDLLLCPTCEALFMPTQETQRYCKSQHRVTGAKRRRKRLLEAWEFMVKVMSDGHISADRARECLEIDAARVEAIVAAWGFTFDRNDVLARAN